MKSAILSLLAHGARTEVELEAAIGLDRFDEIHSAIEELRCWGIVEAHSRQVHEGHNVFRWDREYRLRDTAHNAA